MARLAAGDVPIWQHYPCTLQQIAGCMGTAPTWNWPDKTLSNTRMLHTMRKGLLQGWFWAPTCPLTPQGHRERPILRGKTTFRNRCIRAPNGAANDGHFWC